MPRNGNGEYDLPAGNPVVPGTVIESEWANNTMNDLAVALTDSLTADGQTTPISNLPMGGYHHTGVSDPTLRNQYATLGMSQDGRNTRVQITGGVDNLVGTLVGQANAYVAGALVSFFAPANNTGPMTLNYNGIGARSIVSDNGLPLVAGQVKAGEFYMALYNGSVFVLVTSVGAADSNTFQSSTSGWLRPVGGQYPALTIATASTVNVPAGEGYIVPPGASGAADAVKISWLQQTITLNYLATSFSTTITVDQNGDVQQLPGRAVGANVRTGAILGVVQHFNGVASTIQTQPAIFGDDGYLTRGVSTLLSGSIVSGAKLSANGVAPLQMDISGGIIYQPGASNQTPDSPNTLTINAQANLTFKTLAGEATVGGTVLTNAPVTQYDPNGAGVVTTIPQNGDAVIHRLYFLYGQYIWVFGQFIYTSADVALARIEVDRTNRLTSTRLAGATLIAEIIATKATTTLNGANGIILARGAVYFSIGSSGGIGEAPVDGLAYGRKNAAWSTVVDATSPQVTGNLQITNAGPKVVEVMNPVSGGYAGLNAKQLAFNWCNMEITHPDDKTYFRSYNPANGNLRNTTTWDLATGRWTFPEAAFVAAGGSATDTTAGRLMKVGDFGVGTTYLAADNDANAGSYIISGSHFISSAGGVNFPVADRCFVQVIGGGGGGLQQIFTARTTGKVYSRVFDGAAWSAWVEVATTSQLASYLPLAGGTLSGTLFAPSYTFSNRTGTSIRAAPDVGMVFQTNTGSVYNYGFLNEAASAWLFSIDPSGNCNATGSVTATNIFGQSQSWQSVARNSNTNYTNSTGRPIMVYATQIGGFMQFVVNEYSVGFSGNAINAAGLTGGSFVVPNGATYRVINNSGTAWSSWSELR